MSVSHDFPIPNQSVNLNDVKKFNTSANISALEFWPETQNLNIKDKIQSKLDKIKSYLLFNESSKKKNNTSRRERWRRRIFNFNLDLDTTIKGTKRKLDGLMKLNQLVFHPRLQFLFTQLFARGTVSINGRITFNYQQAHRFFFFFIPMLITSACISTHSHILLKICCLLRTQ